MNSATATKINQVVNTLTVLHQFGTEIDLESILVEEFEQGLASDISNGI